MNKKENWIKNLIWVLIFVSITAQINILIDFGIFKAVQHAKEKRENEKAMLCPPDICTKNEGKTDKTDYKTSVEFEIIELPPLPKIHQK